MGSENPGFFTPQLIMGNDYVPAEKTQSRLLFEYLPFRQMYIESYNGVNIFFLVELNLSSPFPANMFKTP